MHDHDPRGQQREAHTAPLGRDCEPADIRTQLTWILEAPEFAKAKQLSLLLTFLVEQALASSDGGLKESRIAIDFFGRDLSFDPVADNVVRVEVRRLRAKLDEYYENSGWLAPISITVPRGQYLPQVSARAVSLDDAVGRVVAEHRIIETLAQTTDSRLFRAVDEKEHRVAWLWLSSRYEDPVFRRNAIDFVRKVSALNDPNFASVRETSEVAGRVYVVLTPPSGILLNQWLGAGPLAAREAAGITRSIVSGLRALHRAGLTWGGLCPPFVAISIHEGLTSVTLLPIAPGPVDPDNQERSPEQRAGHPPSVRSDIWAAGMIMALMSPKTDEPGGPCARLTRIAEQCLQEDPSQRYPGTRELELDWANDEPAEPAAVVGPPSTHSLWLWAVLAAFVCAVIGLAVWMRPREAAVSRVRVAILPFRVLGSNLEIHPVAKGMAELTASQLGSAPAITVVDTGSDGSVLSVEVLGRKHSIQYVVDGTMLKNGGDLLITARLIRTADQVQTWTSAYEGQWDKVLEMERRIANDAAQAIGRITHNSGDPSSPAWMTSNVEAFRIRSRASEMIQGFISKRDWQQGEAAEKMLRRALELDPTYTDAMVDLGDLAWQRIFPPSPDQLKKVAVAEGWYRKALQSSPENPRALSSLGKLLFFFRDEPGAALEMTRRALAVDPANSQAHLVLADLYLASGFWESAVAEADLALQTSPLSIDFHALKAITLMQLGKNHDAIRAAEALAENSPVRHTIVAWALNRMGEIDEAQSILRKTQSAGPSTISELAALLQGSIAEKRGDRATALSILAATRPGIRITPLRPLLQAQLGLTVPFLQDLPGLKYYHNYRWLIAEPGLEPLRKEPRFRAAAAGLYNKWLKDLSTLGPTLPASPPPLPPPQ